MSLRAPCSSLSGPAAVSVALQLILEGENSYHASIETPFSNPMICGSVETTSEKLRQDEEDDLHMMLCEKELSTGTTCTNLEPTSRTLTWPT